MIPQSTYRLQFNRDFTFSDAIKVIPYLAELGISHCYASPYLRARPGSVHGYDIVDHHQINPDIGSAEDHERFVAALHEHGLGQILDVVPNHMGIMGSDNAWWLDVLENGEASPYAEFFDIDWYPLKHELQGKVLIPVLGDQYGIVLDSGELRLRFDQEKGEFSIFYFQHRFPLDPQEYPRILSCGIAELESGLEAGDQDLLEFQSLIAAFGHLPLRSESDPTKRAERIRDKDIHKRRLAALCARASKIAEFLERVIQRINGTPGKPASFDSLHELIKRQAFRLAHWRVAADDINYRRFFDINDLAALRQEDDNVFRQTHELILELLHEGKVNGLRIDHPDGLHSPAEYFKRLQEAGIEADATPHYIVAEKILTGNEKIPENWPIHGTTGYNFLNLVNGLFVNPASEKKMASVYELFLGRKADFPELAYDCKKLVMEGFLNSELNLLANHLSRIALADRHTCDFTVKSLRDALTEIVALFPVYRTYVNSHGVLASDRMYINEAVNSAIARHSSEECSVYEFIRDLLLGQRSTGRPEYYQRSITRFAMRFQQYTSALMAKGLEDTSFYRYHCLVSLCEVGGNPTRFGVTSSQFHSHIRERARDWLHEMSASSTHDSKRSEDVRARINVLSEMPLAWHRQVRRWRQLNQDKKTLLGSSEAPDANDEYLFYQTLVGSWPVHNADASSENFVQRICQYMTKAIREAKTHTNWATPNERYETAVTNFVKSVLDSKEFREIFLPFQRRVSHFGMLNSLSQTLIKLTAPGVPDIYQGNELWDFSLVDPDNRRPVDYGVRGQALEEVRRNLGCPGPRRDSYLRSMTRNMENGRIKLYVTTKALQLRRKLISLFTCGEYLELVVRGDKSEHLLAFARRFDNQFLLVAVPRLNATLLKGRRQMPCGEEIWSDTMVDLNDHLPGRLRNIFTGETVESDSYGTLRSVPAQTLLATFPVALLVMETSQ